MRDINGKVLSVGDQITSHGIGLSRITRVIEEEDNVERDGAYVEVEVIGYKDVKREIHLIVAGAVKVRTMKELGREALTVQDACNLSGVVISFSNVIREVRAILEAEGKGGTDPVNTHPVCVLYSSKIASLTGSESASSFTQAYNWACEVSK